MPDYAAGVGVQLLHRLTGLAVVMALGLLARAAWQAQRRTSAVLLAGLTALQVGLGGALVLGQLPLGAALAHNLVAALLLGTVAALMSTSARLSPRF